VEEGLTAIPLPETCVGEALTGAGASGFTRLLATRCIVPSPLGSETRRLGGLSKKAAGFFSNHAR
jgi:hypothetical protein